MAPNNEIPSNEDPDSPYENFHVIATNDMHVQDRISLFVAALKDNPEDASLAESALRFLLSHAQERSNSMLEADVTEQVVSIIQHNTGHEIIMELAIAVLACFQRDHALANDFAIHEVDGGVAALVSLLRRFSDNDTIQRLPRHDNASPNDHDGHRKDAIKEAGGIPVLVKFLEMYGPIDSDMSECGLTWALEGIALMAAGECNSDVRAAVIELCGVEIIVKTMKCHISNIMLQFHALDVLQSLAEENDDKSAEAFVAADGTHTVLAMIKEHPDEASVISGGIEVLGRLATNTAALADTFVLQGGLEAIFTAMPRFVDERYVQFCAVETLCSCLLNGSASYINPVIHSVPSAISSMVEVVRRHSEHDELHQMAMSALASMTFSVDLCHKFILSGGLPLLSKPLQEGSADIKLQVAAVCVIGNVAKAGDIAASKKGPLHLDLFEPIYNAGLVPILLEILNHPSEIDQPFPIVISSLLAMAKNHDGIKKQIVSAGGIKGIASIEKKGGQAVPEAHLLLECLEDSENEEKHTVTETKVPNKSSS